MYKIAILRKEYDEKSFEVISPEIEQISEDKSEKSESSIEPEEEEKKSSIEISQEKQKIKMDFDYSKIEEDINFYQDSYPNIKLNVHEVDIKFYRLCNHVNENNFIGFSSVQKTHIAFVLAIPIEFSLIELFQWIENCLSKISGVRILYSKFNPFYSVVIYFHKQEDADLFYEVTIILNSESISRFIMGECLLRQKMKTTQMNMLMLSSYLKFLYFPMH
jgi:hypothetical protein